MVPIPLPWLIVGVLVSLFGTYRVGHHYGWLERDNDMKIAIAKKNEEARELEKNMTSKLSDQETKLRKAQDEIAKKKSAMHELARTGKLRLPTASCPQASPNSSTPAGDSRPDNPMQANLSDRLLQLLSTSQQKETKPSPNSTPVSQPTTK